MKNILKTILYLPPIFVLGTIFYGIMVCFILLAYFVGLLMLPTKLHGYLVQLEAYRRIQK